MRLSEYQVEAGKHIDRFIFNRALEEDALHGMATELGALNSYYLQNSKEDPDGLDGLKQDRLGGLLIHISEMCIAHNWSMEDIAERSLRRLRMEH